MTIATSDPEARGILLDENAGYVKSQTRHPKSEEK